MQTQIVKMINDFEHGRLSRRQLITYLTGMFAASLGAAGYEIGEHPYFDTVRVELGKHALFTPATILPTLTSQELECRMARGYDSHPRGRGSDQAQAFL